MPDRQSCMVIAEAGVNHNGRLDIALKLCDAAKKMGADVIKFQTWKTERLITRGVAQAGYQVENTGVEESQFDMLKRLELPYDSFRAIKKYCDTIGLQFASTADEEESLDFLVSLGVPFIKVGSGDIGNISFLRHIGSKGLPVILSTGMSTLGDIDISVHALREGGASDITLLHCTTSYPCAYEDVNLKAMASLRETFHLPVGYSDHTMGQEVSIAATALGAAVIEKHFTLDRRMDGPDHVASIEPDEFAELVKAVRRVETCLGTGIKEPTAVEKLIAPAVTKRIVARRQISKGEVFTEENICVKRSDSGAAARHWDKVIGERAGRRYDVDEGILHL